jgi:hypothetical protein
VIFRGLDFSCSADIGQISHFWMDKKIKVIPSKVAALKAACGSSVPARIFLNRTGNRRGTPLPQLRIHASNNMNRQNTFT